MQRERVLSNVSIIIALYFLTYFIYSGVINPVPALGDSWDYHIPIAQTLLDGRFLTPIDFRLPQWYYPGSSEVINSFFITLGIPLTLSNIFAAIVLFFCLLKLALVFGLKRYSALIFAVTFVTLNGVVRWLNAVGVDIWVAVYFSLTILLLENPKPSLGYFAKVGFVTGMLVGSKYTAVLFLIPLVLIYSKSFMRFISPKRIVVFFIPFSVFGLFWYLRNYFATGNPFYPLPIFGFTGQEIFQGFRIWKIALSFPKEMFDSALAEYKIWLFTVPLAFVFLVRQIRLHGHLLTDSTNRLFILGIANILLFLTFPTSSQPWVMVSSFRYSYPAFIPLILGVFLLAKKYKKEELLGYLAIANMIMVTSLEYHPKLVLIYLPFAILIFWLLSHSSKLFR